MFVVVDYTFNLDITPETMMAQSIKEFSVVGTDKKDWFECYGDIKIGGPIIIRRESVLLQTDNEQEANNFVREKYKNQYESAIKNVKKSIKVLQIKIDALVNSEIYKNAVDTNPEILLGSDIVTFADVDIGDTVYRTEKNIFRNFSDISKVVEPLEVRRKYTNNTDKISVVSPDGETTYYSHKIAELHYTYTSAVVVYMSEMIAKMKNKKLKAIEKLKQIEDYNV